ncbi:MAG TPA: 4-(cytidine 5'-diphospho)-2-C-methyl-D-erythritol kinase [Firmicutes bacterium]|jgi:4-diphosphocytidyl-2-C-methyl-D-erythritol kinase|nr:4-(cytidine 5'-diphospho)-2-C-methyl-D-erythritol kinase [Bacillota bacterium]
MSAWVEVLAPAKINLTLTIKGRRDDGYHELESLMVPLALADVVRCQATAEDRIVVRCAHPQVPTGRENLAVQAAELLRKHVCPGRGAEIIITKRIPVAAGLAGGSTDAAATLLALNQLWGLGLTVTELHNLASQLGADVPFCLHARAAIGRGRGERLQFIEPMANWPVVLVNPGFALSTRVAYALFDQNPVVNDHTSALEVARLLRDGLLVAAAQHAQNHLQDVVASHYPAVAELLHEVRATGMPFVAQTGSGPTIFAVGEDAKMAQRAARLLAGNPERLILVTKLEEFSGEKRISVNGKSI